MGIVIQSLGAASQVGHRPVEQIRKDFPILGTRLPNGRPLVYLDNAATTQKPFPVLEAERGFYERMNANVHRGIHSLAEAATAAYEQAREKLQVFINARDRSEIVFTHSCTESINLVAHSWGRKFLKSGDEILLSEMEHHSNLIPWQLLAADLGLTLRFIPFDSGGRR